MRTGAIFGIIALALSFGGCATEDNGDYTDDPFWDEFETSADGWSMGMPDPGWEVWEPVHAWTDTAPNGETYEEYYGTWLRSIQYNSNGREVHYTLADGTVVPAPSLECADSALFLRFLFASEYGLPMFVRGWVDGGWHFFGHFGWLNSSGVRVRNYRQHPVDAERGSYAPLQNRSSYLPDNLQDYPVEDSTIGEYLDAALTNKRMGYFLQDLWNMIYSGTIVENFNSYYIQPDYIREGDLQMHRYDLTGGIGHTITIQNVERGATGRLIRVDIIQSYMPTLPWVGNGYSELTGYTPNPEVHSGLRRWRRPELRNGRWYNMVDEDVAAWDAEVPDFPERFEELFSMSAADEVAAMIETIEIRRTALVDNPNSCRRREEREAAFANLYELYMATPELYEELGFENEPTLEEIRPTVDRLHRTIDDFIWSELNYEQARTCHWNPSDTDINNDMYEATVEFNRQVLETYGCEGIRIFRAEDAEYCEGRDGLNATNPEACASVDDGFQDLRAFATEGGWGWADYLNDEHGDLTDSATDELANPDTISYFCELYEDLQFWTLP